MSNRIRVLLVGSTLTVCLVASHCRGQVEVAPTDGAEAVDVDVLDGLTDGRPLVGDELPGVAAAMSHAARSPAASAREAARRFLQRRRAVPAFRENRDDRIDVFADLQADPEAYRGQPVVVWGRVLETAAWDPMGAEPREWRTAEVAVHDDPDNPAILVLPNTAAKAGVGSPIACVGFFLKLDADRIPILATGGWMVLGDRLDEELMRSVEHFTRARPEERDAYLTAIAQARMADQQRLSDAARAYRDQRIGETRFQESPEEYPTYVDLFRRPEWEFYGGRPVTLEGHVWSVSKVPAFNPDEGDENEYGFEDLYVLYLYTEDSQTNAAEVVCTEIPEGMPTSGHLDELLDGVRATGFLFKMRVYDDQEGRARKIPVLIARTVDWENLADVKIVPRFPRWAYGAIAGVLLAMIGVGWWIGMADRAARRARLGRVEGGQPRFDAIDDREVGP